jgi:arsenite/tail-anchored protein-transporting ATPase
MPRKTKAQGDSNRSQRAGSNDSETRVIFYVGKGGVGKTTLAAATAARAAELGHRTLVVSTDIAHSLGDILGVELGAEPIPIASNLYAQEINVLEEMRSSWGKVQDQMVSFLRKEGVSDIQADELAIVPGMEDVAALIQIERKIRDEDYDCIVVDAAPTGETIRLLSMPEAFAWYASRLEDWRGRLARYVGPFLRGAIRELNIVETTSQIAARVRELRSILTDPQRSSYRLVMTPDRMVLREAQRAETYLNIFEYPIDATVVNQVLAPTDPGDGNSSVDGYVRALVAGQSEIKNEIRDAFPTLPMFESPLLAGEPVGVEALSGLARQVFGDRDPTEVMHVGPTQTIERQENGYVLKIPMPNVEVDKLSLRKRGDRLYIDLGSFRREIALPAALAMLVPDTARVHGGQLLIPFVPDEK